MTKISGQTVVFFLLVAVFVVPSLAQEPTVRVAGVQVIRETVGEDFGNKLVPFNTHEKGSSLALIVAAGAGKIIALDDEASKVQSFVDDKGTNLLAGESRFGRDGFGPFPKVSEDGKAGMMEVRGSGAPAAGATKLRLKGSIAVVTGSKTEAVKSTPFLLKEGSKVSVGNIELTVEKVGKPDFGDHALEVTVSTSNNEIKTIADVKFLDENGGEVEVESTGSSSSGFNGQFDYQKSYGLSKNLDGKKVVLQFEVWTDLEEKVIPVDITASLGG